MKLSSYARTLHDLGLLKDQGLDEVILEHKDFSRYGKLGDAEFLTLASRARELGLRVLFEWDILMTENTFRQLADKLPSFVESFDYTAAEINSVDEFSFGKFEIRCKIAKGKGFFPAFWTFGGNGYNEIDVFEFWNEENIYGKYDSDKLSKVHKMNNHFDYEFDGSSEDCPSSYEGTDFSVDFHVFTVIWTPFKIEWFVDGKLKRVSTLFYSLLGQPVDCEGLEMFQEYILNTAFPRNKMKIIANFGIQSGKNSPDENTPFPSEMEIDYIRYYK